MLLVFTRSTGRTVSFDFKSEDTFLLAVSTSISTFHTLRVYYFVASPFSDYKMRFTHVIKRIRQLGNLHLRGSAVPPCRVKKISILICISE